MKTVVPLIVVIALVGWGPAARAGGPKQTVVSGHERINALLRRQRRQPARAKILDKKIRRLVESLIDFQTLARKSLGRHWSELDDARKKEYVTLFTELVESSYLKKLKTRLSYQVHYGKVETNGGQAKVASRVIRVKHGRKMTTDITYKLAKIGGRWKVVDVVTNEVSLTRNYRRSFGRIWRREGYEGLIRKMKRKIAKM